MKSLFTPLIFVASLLFVTLVINSCAKPDHSSDLPKEQQVVGQWYINRIQLKIFTNGVFVKDTILQRAPKPQNIVIFDANGGFTYQFNTTSQDVGTYQFVGADSLVSTTPTTIYRWKMLTLTSVLFTVVNTSTDPAYPGSIVETYHTFVR